MTHIREGSLDFYFDSECHPVEKYDELKFYRRQFKKTCSSTKAVDFICGTDSIRYLIEVKDYRLHARTKPSGLAEEVAQKARDTLAGLAACATNAHDPSEKRCAADFLSGNDRIFRLVLHLEQPSNPTRLRPTPIDPAAIKQKLKQVAKAIDPHPLVLSQHDSTSDIPWRVSSASP